MRIFQDAQHENSSISGQFEIYMISNSNVSVDCRSEHEHRFTPALRTASTMYALNGARCELSAMAAVADETERSSDNPFTRAARVASVMVNATHILDPRQGRPSELEAFGIPDKSMDRKQEFRPCRRPAFFLVTSIKMLRFSKFRMILL